MKTINDIKYIEKLFKSIARLNYITTTIYYNNKIFRAVMHVKNMKASEICVICEEHLYKDSVITIVFNFDYTLYGFDAVIESEFLHTAKGIEYSYSINMPTFINVDHRRQLIRHEIHDHDIILSVSTDKYDVVDISTKGLAFRTSNNNLLVGQKIYNALLQIENEDFYLDFIIKWCQQTREGTYTYGVTFCENEWVTHSKLFKYIYKNDYPDLKTFDQVSEDEIYQLYEKSGYFQLKECARDNFKCMSNSLKNIWNNPSICHNIVFCEGGKAISCASTLRIYNQTYIAQHLASDPLFIRNFKSKIDVYAGINDFLLNNMHFNYYLMYFDKDLHFNSIYSEIFKLINDKSKFNYDNIYIMTFDLNSCNTEQSFEYSFDELNNENTFIEYCKSNLTHLENCCYSYDVSNFYQTELKAVYEALGLFLKRKVWEFKKGNKLLSYVVTECYTQGLNMFNLLDSSRIYLSEDFTIESLREIIPFIKNFYKKYKKSSFNVMLKDFDITSVNIEGMKNRVLAGRVMANREGGIEYRNILNFKKR